MHLLYADDSGSVGDASQAYFVLGGVCVFERQPHWIGQELDKIAELQKLATDFKVTGHSFGQVRNLAEVPVFIDSRASRLVQLADLIAYATFRKYEANDSRFFDLFAHRFDEYGGQKHGLHVYPTPE